MLDVHPQPDSLCGRAALVCALVRILPNESDSSRLNLQCVRAKIAREIKEAAVELL